MSEDGRDPGNVSAVTGVRDALINRTDEDWQKLEDAIGTLWGLQPGHVLTESDVEGLRLMDTCHREDEETATDAYHRGREEGLRERGGDELVQLTERYERAVSERSVERAMRIFDRQAGFREGLCAMREMLARFVEQGGDAVTAASLRANWNPEWGTDPQAHADTSERNDLARDEPNPSPPEPSAGWREEGSSNASRARTGPVAHPETDAEPSAARNIDWHQSFPSPGEMVWRPIRTAPKTRRGDAAVAIILGFAPDEEGYSPTSREGFWCAVQGHWASTLDPGWQSPPQPTHWMPLPPPPLEPAKSASGPVGELEEHKALSPLVGQGNEGSSRTNSGGSPPLRAAKSDSQEGH